MRPKVILYDLDGVLVDACEWHYIALNKALKEIAGDVISRTEHETTFNGLPTKTKMEIMVNQGRVKAEDIDLIYARKQNFTKDTIKESAKVDDPKILLHQFTISKGIHSACVSNCSRETAELMLERTGQMPYLLRIWANEDSQNPKPHPEPYIRAMIHFGYQPEDVLIVEDSERGIKAANLTAAKVWHVKNALMVTKENMEKQLKGK